MRKLILIALIAISGLVAVPVASAATVNPQVYVQQNDRRYRSERWRGDYVTRYQYVWVRDRQGKVFRYVYRVVFNRRGELIDRQYVGRERVRQYDGRRERETGLRFNIFLDF